MNAVLDLEILTIEQDHREARRRAEDRKRAEDRARIQERLDERNYGTCGDLDCDLFGEGDTPLFFINKKGTRK